MNCEGCGKSFYPKSMGAKGRIKCCSRECRQIRLHKLGVQRYWKCVEQEIGVSLEYWIRERINKDEWTILRMSKELGMDRTSITRFMIKHGMKPRTLSEDMNRRYSMMTPEQIKNQTSASHIGMRAKMQDEEWKSEHMRKVLKAQNFNESMPERMFKDGLQEAGITGWEEQYQLKWWSIDVAFPKQKIAVEIDGQFWHRYPNVIQKDRRKDEWLTLRGWRVLRFNADTMTKDIFSYIDILEKELVAI